VTEGGFDDGPDSDAGGDDAGGDSRPAYEPAAPSQAFDAPREFVPERAPEVAREPQFASPAPSYEAPRTPEPRSFDFDRPSAPVAEPVAPREAAPAPAPAPAPIATAVEPREWTPTPATDVTTPRNEP
jgi:fused signal recognition particle receptor